MKLKEGMKDTYETSQDMLGEMQRKIDKVIKILEQFDAYLEPQDTMKIRKCIEILKGE